MCSFDICSLFTCVPILETINICADMLYWKYLTPPDITEVVFVELMKFTTTYVKFSFNNIMYWQVDGISMGPTVDGIFVGFPEVELFSKYKAPVVYFHYMDYTLCVFGRETEAGKFFSHLNSMNPALGFFLEKENNFTLPFLDVLVYKDTSAFLTTVYHKPTFTGLYIRWTSFCPKKRKINLIKTLTHPTLMICSESKLDYEVEFTIGHFVIMASLKSLFNLSSGIKFLTSVKLNLILSRGVPVYLRLPWFGDISDRFANQISACVHKCYFSSNLTVLTSGRKDVLPAPIRTSIDKIRENGFELTKKRSRRYPAKTITDADYIAILANTPDQAETLLHSLERAAAGIGLYVNAHKTEYMCYNQTGDISTLEGTPLKLVDKFTYLGSSVESTEKDIEMRLTKAWTAINRLSIIWKSDLTDKMKHSFFQAAVTSILLYGCTTWTLTKRLEKKLDGNYTRMLCAILNKSWRQHPTRHQLYGHLPLITKTIQVRRTRKQDTAGEAGTNS